MVHILGSKSLKQRLRMAVTEQLALEGDPELRATNPEWWVSTHIDRFATQPGWGPAFASATISADLAIASDPGASEVVITDGMILAAVQAILSADASTAAMIAQTEADAKVVEDARLAAADVKEQTKLKEFETWRHGLQQPVVQPMLPAEPSSRKGAL